MRVSTGPKFDAPTLDITCDDDDDNFLGQYDSDNFSDDENYDDEEDDLLDDNQLKREFILYWLIIVPLGVSLIVFICVVPFLTQTSIARVPCCMCDEDFKLQLDGYDDFDKESIQAFIAANKGKVNVDEAYRNENSDLAKLENTHISLCLKVAAQYFIPAYYRTFHSENLTQSDAQALMGQREVCPSNRFENLRLIEEDTSKAGPNNWKVYDIKSNTFFKEMFSEDGDFTSQTCTQDFTYTSDCSVEYDRMTKMLGGEEHLIRSEGNSTSINLLCN